MKPFAWAAALAFASSAIAGEPAPEAGPSAKLEALAFLVGHCWRGEFATRGHVDTHCFEPVFGGQHIRDRHEVTGGKEVYRGETIYSWDADSGRVEYVYWNSLGGVSRGTMVPKGGVLDFGDESHTLPDGNKLVISTLWRPVGDASYEVVSTRNGVTGERIVTYRRVD